MTGAAFLLLAASRNGRSIWKLVLAGALFGVAFAFKYNAAVYAVAGVFALFVWRRLTPGALAALSTGFLLPVAGLLGWFWSRHAISALYEATIAYNLRYSGETYSGPIQMATYLLAFPVRHARVDALWLLGGSGGACDVMRC